MRLDRKCQCMSLFPFYLIVGHYAIQHIHIYIYTCIYIYIYQLASPSQLSCSQQYILHAYSVDASYTSFCLAKGRSGYAGRMTFLCTRGKTPFSGTLETSDLVCVPPGVQMYRLGVIQQSSASRCEKLTWWFFCMDSQYDQWFFVACPFEILDKQANQPKESSLPYNSQDLSYTSYR